MMSAQLSTTPKFERWARQIVKDEISATFPLKAIIRSPRGTRLHKLMTKSNLLFSVIFANHTVNDGVVDYFKQKYDVTHFFKQIFVAREGAQIDECMSSPSSIIVSIICKVNAARNTYFTRFYSHVISAMNILRLPKQIDGLYISYVGTTDELYSEKYGSDGDFLSWKGRGLCASLMLVASQLSRACYGNSILYLQSDDALTLTYSKFGFELVTADDACFLYAVDTGIEAVPCLNTMRLVGTPMSSVAGTPAMYANDDDDNPNRRLCCLAKAWSDLSQDHLFQYDKKLVDMYDVYHHEKLWECCVGRCSLCGHRAIFRWRYFKEQYYAFIDGHTKHGCPGISKEVEASLDKLRWEMLECLHSDVPDEHTLVKVSNRY